jgi:hypothetical protein
MASSDSRKPHPWRFFRSGGFDQVLLTSGADVAALRELDPKLWAALACPSKGLEMDPRTLELLDLDGDGRIRVSEVIEAATWAARMLRNPDELLTPGDTLAIDAIDDSTPAGEELLASARQILEGLGKPDAGAISVEDTVDTNRIFAQTCFNGDGIIPPAAAADEATRRVIDEAMACVGTDTDRSGAPGLSGERAERFFAEARAYSEWWADAEADAGTVLPFGESTDDVDALYEALGPKIDDWFTRQRLARFDPRAADALNPPPEGYQALASRTLSPQLAELAALPLATVAPGRSLPLTDGVNPAWADTMARFRRQIVAPVLGDRESLSEEDWAEIHARFAAHARWLAARRGEAVAALGLGRVREILASGAEAEVAALIAKDRSLEGAAKAIGKVEKLVRLRRDLATFLNNFVSFRDFYTGKAKAIFQAGTLYLDGRSCDLCVRIDDVAKHSALANRSRTYLAYCECRHRGTDERMNIAAAFTDGTPDNLMVGRNGVFYDRRGEDWDATVVKILEHPISMRQAFWEPYRRMGRMVSDQIEKVAAAKVKEVDDAASAGMSGTATKAVAATPGPAAAPPQPFDVAKFAGIFAAVGLAIGAIGTALASLVTGFMGLAWWQMPLAVGGLLLVVSGPSMVVAYMKLRARTLAPILDANGWAVNTQATINIPFGASLTSLAALPAGSQRSLHDPFAEKQRPWKTYGVLAAVVVLLGALWHKGVIQRGYEAMKAQVPASTAEPAAAKTDAPKPLAAPTPAKPAAAEPPPPVESARPTEPPKPVEAPKPAEPAPAPVEPKAPPAKKDGAKPPANK